MRILNKLTLLLLLIVLTIAACKEESPTVQEEKSTIDLNSLQGEWIIDTVKVGKKIAPSLNGGVFNFVDDKTFLSGVNLQGTGIEVDQSTTYEIDGESIKIMGNEAILFNIQKLDAENMILDARLRGLECKFNFSRKED